MYHISEEYRIGHRRARYHYNRARLSGLMPVGVALAFLYYAGDYYSPLLYGALGGVLALHMVLWAAYEAHFGGRHSGWVRHKLEKSDDWFPSLVILCQNGFFVITLAVFWFIVCRLGFPAGILDQGLLAVWVLAWPLLRVTRARLYFEADNTNLDTTHEFLRLLCTSIIALLFADLITDFSVQENVRDPNQDQSLLGIFVWLPAALVIVACIVLFADHVLRKRPRRGNQDEFDVL